MSEKIYNKYGYSKYNDRHIAIIDGNIIAIGATIKELIYKLDNTNIENRCEIIKYIKDNVVMGKNING